MAQGMAGFNLALHWILLLYNSTVCPGSIFAFMTSK